MPLLAGGSGLSTLTTAGTGALAITSLTSSNATLIFTQNDTAAVTVTTLTDTSLSNLTIGGTGPFNIGNMTITPTSFAVTNTDTGAVTLGSQRAISVVNATAPSYINGGTGTFTVYEADNHANPTTVSLINGVNYFLSDGVPGNAANTNAITISGASDNSTVGIYLGNYAINISSAQTSSSTTLTFGTSGTPTTGVAVGMLVTDTNIPVGTL